MTRYRTNVVYSVAHFAIDFSCAFLVIRSVSAAMYQSDLLLLYNFLAFAMQMPLGILADYSGNGRVFSAAGCLMIAVSSLFGAYPVWLCVLAGTGNALFHIGGGYDILSLSQGKAASLGLFVSPGALGLFAGTLMGRSSHAVWLVALLMCICSAAIIALCPHTAPACRQPARNLTRNGLMVLVLLFLAVCLRSFGGFSFGFGWKNGIWAWVFVLCTVLGKAAGGLLCDRIGPLRTTVISLAAGALLFIGSSHPVPGCMAVLLFNMTMPVTLRSASDVLRDMPGFSFGLLTMALFIGFIPMYADCPVPDHPMTGAILCLITLALLIPIFRRSFT